jgi:hypothetical protein
VAKKRPAPVGTPDASVDEAARDREALELRSAGTSFAKIARSLGYGQARDANDGFHRAMRLLPLAERRVVRSAEFARLDELERTVRGDDRLTSETMAKRLHTIDRLRDRLLADTAPSGPA